MDYAPIDVASVYQLESDGNHAQIDTARQSIVRQSILSYQEMVKDINDPTKSSCS